MNTQAPEQFNSKTYPAKSSLTWGLVMATYKRETILLRCLHLAAAQTRPPVEIIVVDGSPNWEHIRDRAQQEIGDRYPHIRFVYIPAKRPSLTVQRNQGIDLATADVLFLIDDDSLMYPNCAEEIMRVYEADVREQVKGVSAIHVPQPPDLVEPGEEPQPWQQEAAQHPKQTLLRRIVKSILSPEKVMFLPYEQDHPIHPMPPELEGLNVGTLQSMIGFSMTLRRSVFQLERFNEVLSRYAAFEDRDLTYRVSRHGVLINALDAHLCHLYVSGGRLTPYTVAALTVLNPAFLQRFYGRDIHRLRRQWKWMVSRRIFIYFLKELADQRWSFASTRGALYGLRQLDTIYSKSPQELEEFYPALQAQLIDNQ